MIRHARPSALLLPFSLRLALPARAEEAAIPEGDVGTVKKAEYREYATEERRSRPGCSGGRM